MKELQDIINDLQARLAIVGGGRIIITSDHVSISLGEEHENFDIQENNTDYDGDDLDEDLDAEDVFEAQNSKSPTRETDVEMFTQMWGQ
jgi:hypothetical protein|tara:strand:+ start:1598 stop:1864 length:267 start_codon:yes stop_codon:yes gene_type:complete